MFLREAREARTKWLQEEKTRLERQHDDALAELEKHANLIDKDKCRAAYLESYAKYGSFAFAKDSCMSSEIPSIKSPSYCDCDWGCSRCEPYSRYTTEFQKRNPHFGVIHNRVILRETFFH